MRILKENTIYNAVFSHKNYTGISEAKKICIIQINFVNKPTSQVA